MSWVKIPCVLAAMLAVHIAGTPPTPPPSKQEQVPSKGLEALIKQRFTPMTVTTIGWIAALAEILVIVASSLPNNPFSQQVISGLTKQGTVEYIHFSPLFLIGTFLAILGGYVRYLCFRELGKMFTFELSIRKDHKLITTGPYAFVRHPSYIGAVCTLLGMTLINVSSGSWARVCGVLGTLGGQIVAVVYLTFACSISFGLLSRIPREDKMLRDKFPKEWEEWAARVPFLLIPGVL